MKTEHVSPPLPSFKRASFSNDRSDARMTLRPYLVSVGLILVTCCQLADTSGRMTVPLTWLLIALLGVSGWVCSNRQALVASAVTLIVWSGIELVRATDWTGLLIGQAMRLLIALWLVIWIGRLRERLIESHRFARLDSLTGLHNRQALVEALTAELSRASRLGGPFTLILFDCDGFKMINDLGGHLAGDAVLRKIGMALRQHTRPYDCVGRLGGDEFLLVLSKVDQHDAVLVAERLRTTLHQFTNEDQSSLTFSVGVVTFAAIDPSGSLDWEECIRLVDTAMYVAKRRGRDETQFEVVASEVRRTIPMKG
jgi:diguanylate cyclase (GGDEF)-like protein